MIIDYNYLSANNYLIIQGYGSGWVIHYEVSNRGAYIQSKKPGLLYIPVRGWQYMVGSMQDDDTLTVTGKYISCLNFN